MDEKELREKIFTALGEASMCWEPIPVGVFDSTKAQRIGDELVSALKSKEEPLSTPDLIAELERRRPKCSVETCGHIGSELCGTCIWGVFIGEEDGSIKDNFKEAK